MHLLCFSYLPHLIHWLGVGGSNEGPSGGNAAGQDCAPGRVPLRHLHHVLGGGRGRAQEEAVIECTRKPYDYGYVTVAVVATYIIICTLYTVRMYQNISYC